MVTVRAPYPSKMDEIHNQSIVTLDRPGAGDVANFSNRTEVVNSLRIRNNPEVMAKAIRRIGSGDVEAKDIVIRDWYKPFDNSVNIPNIPSLQASGYAKSVAWSSDGLFLAVAHSVTPFMTVYRRTGDVFTKLANPFTRPSADGYGLAWSMHSKVLYIGSIDKTCRAYTKDTAGSLSLAASGINVFNPVPAFSIYKMVMTKDTMYAALVILENETNKVIVYKRNSTTSIGYTGITAVNNIPSTAKLPEALSWSQAGTYLALGNTQATGPWLDIYKRTGDVFAKLISAIDSPPAYGVSSLAFSLDDKYMAVGMPTNNELRIYKKADNSDFWSYLTGIANAQAGNPGQIKNLTWTPDGKYILITTETSPYMLAYKFENDTLTRIDCFGGATNRTVSNIEISPDGAYLACASNTTPWVEVYKSSLTPHPVPYVRADPTAPLIDYTLAAT